MLSFGKCESKGSSGWCVFESRGYRWSCGSSGGGTAFIFEHSKEITTIQGTIDVSGGAKFRNPYFEAYTTGGAGTYRCLGWNGNKYVDIGLSN